MHIKGLGLGGLMAIVALVGCGSSSGTGGTAGSTGKGGSTGTAGSTGSAGSTGTAGKSGGGGSTASGGSGGAFTTSVPGGTKLTGLTTAQQTQLCNDVGNYADHTVRPTVCAALTSAFALEAAYSDLQANPSASNAELQAACAGSAADAGTCFLDADGGTDTCNISSIPSTCQATVSDYTKCINDQATINDQYYASFPSCSTLTAAKLNAFFAADGGGSSAGPAEPTSCSMFDSTCDADGGTAAMTNMSALPKMTRKR